MSKSLHIALSINGQRQEIDIEPNAVLLHTLRDLGYTDVKNGCEIGECGACAVFLNGKPVNSCMVLTVQADGAEIVTNAGLGTMDKPHIIQEAFADAGAIQCGFCTPGMVISTKALLDHNPDPSEDEIREALSGNLCRCTGYGFEICPHGLRPHAVRPDKNSILRIVFLSWMRTRQRVIRHDYST